MTTSQQIIDRACDAGAEFELLRDCNGAYALLHVPSVGTLSARASDSELARDGIVEQIEAKTGQEWTKELPAFHAMRRALERLIAVDDPTAKDFEMAREALALAEQEQPRATSWPALPNLQPITTKLNEL